MIQIRHTRKRSKRSTRKRSIRKGGQLWTPTRNAIFTHRKQAANYANASKNAANRVKKSTNAYYTLKHKPIEQKDVRITEAEALEILNTPTIALTEYAMDIRRNVNLLLRDRMMPTITKQHIMKQQRQLEHNMILANHAIARTQQAAYIAALGHLVNENIPDPHKQTIQLWNNQLQQRQLENEKISTIAKEMIANQSSIEKDVVHRRFLLMKQIADHIKWEDRIYILGKTTDMSGKLLRTPLEIIEKTRAHNNKTPIKQSLKRINDHNNYLVLDRVIPLAAQTVLLMLVEAAYAYLSTLEKNSDSYTKHKNDCDAIQLELKNMNRIHNYILVEIHKSLGPILSNESKDLKEKIATIEAQHA